jgi:hypothetical protein
MTRFVSHAGAALPDTSTCSKEAASTSRARHRWQEAGIPTVQETTNNPVRKCRIADKGAAWVLPVAMFCGDGAAQTTPFWRRNMRRRTLPR